MSKFNKKASSNKGTGKSDVDWAGFNAHLLEKIGKSKLRQAVVSGIVDVGVQNREDAEYDYKGEERQDKLLEEGKATLNEEGTKIIQPRNPADSIVIFADFPSIMINYGKFLSKDKEDDFKPYRHLITGEFKGLAEPCALTCKSKDGKWVYDAKHRVSQLANAMDLVEGDVPQDFQIGDLLGGAFMMEMGVTKNGEYVNVKAKNIVPMMEGMSAPEYNLEPFGVMFEGGNDKEDLVQIRASVRKLMELSPDWVESAVKAELEALSSSSSSSTSSESPKKAVPQKAAPKKIELDDDEEDDDDSLPF